VPNRIGRASLIAALFLSASGLRPLAAQDIPSRPAGMTDAQIQQQIQQRGLGDQLRQRIQQSGLTPDQVRARLRAAGYSENLVDAYLGAATAGQAAPAPSAEVLRAAGALGLADFTLADTTAAKRDSLVLSRTDSFLLDTLDLVVGRDSIPTRRDETGALRVDTAGVRVLADRTRRPRIFGLDVFRRVTNQFAVATSGPVDPDYRLGPGDQLILILTGDVELAHELAVSREGTIVVPQVGQIAVANLTMTQLRALLFQRLGRVYSGVRPANASTRFDVTVTRIRVNQVFVTGEVVRPGSYAVSAIGTVLNALYQAGGPTERGSFRQIRVMRGGQPVATLDLYDYLLGGGSQDAIRLESGDVVFVPPALERVTLEGRVLRPAIYELKASQGLRELVAMAGGLQPDAYTGRANIERILPPEQRQPGGRDRIVLDVDLNAALASGGTAVPLEPNDRIRILGISQPVRNRVLVRGNVWQPGSIAVTPGMRLSGALAAAGGLRNDSYLDRAHILRLMPDSTRQLIPVDLREVLKTGAAGPARDPELQEFDEVTVYSRTEFRPSRQLSIFGSVQRPGAMAFRDSMTLRDAVMLAGGPRDEAYLLEAEISRIPSVAGGDTLATIIRVPLDSSYVLDRTGYLRRPTGARDGDVLLQPFDNIFIRRIPGFTFQRNVVITGEVRFPGRYTIIHADERVSDLIQRAGGFTEAAYVRGAQFSRAEGRGGRVGLDLERVLRDPGFRDNLILLVGDSLHVPLYQPVVQVEGSVNSPVGVSFVSGQSADYYVDRAGGFARRADKKRTYIVQPNGSVVRRGERVEPGARVVVPEKPADEQRANVAQVMATTMAFLASILSIVVLAKQL
jgi:protein involved in polysaccharide export with SLBB domain